MSEKYITAFAPASIGNIAVGFDMLGLAISGVGDRVSARRVEEEGVMIKEIYDLNNNPMKIYQKTHLKIQPLLQLAPYGEQKNNLVGWRLLFIRVFRYSQEWEVQPPLQ